MVRYLKLSAALTFFRSILFYKFKSKNQIKTLIQSLELNFSFSIQHFCITSNSLIISNNDFLKLFPMPNGKESTINKALDGSIYPG